jgi:hypothetical protein
MYVIRALSALFKEEEEFQFLFWYKALFPVLYVITV